MSKDSILLKIDNKELDNSITLKNELEVEEQISQFDLNSENLNDSLLLTNKLSVNRFNFHNSPSL